MVTQFLPPVVKRAVAKLVYLICIISSTIYFIHTGGLFVSALQSGIIDVRSVDMPQWVLYAPMPVCFFFVVMEFGRFLIGIDDMYSDSIEARGGM